MLFSPSIFSPDSAVFSLVRVIVIISWVFSWLMYRLTLWCWLWRISCGREILTAHRQSHWPGDTHGPPSVPMQEGARRGGRGSMSCLDIRGTLHEAQPFVLTGASILVLGAAAQTTRPCDFPVTLLLKTLTAFPSWVAHPLWAGLNSHVNGKWTGVTYPSSGQL